MTVLNSGEGIGREVVQEYLEGTDDDPSGPLQVLAGFALIDASRSSRDLRANTQWCCDEIEADARHGGAVG